MARTRTLEQLRDDVCKRADVVQDTSGRFTPEELNRYINQAIQEYMTLVVRAGGTNYFKKRTGLLTMGTSQTRDSSGWAPYMYLPLPDDFFSLIGIDLYVSNVPISLTQFENAERNSERQYALWFTTQLTGQPVYYRIGGTNAAGTKVIEVTPFANAAYQYELLYVPVIPDLVNDSDTFDGLAGYEEFVVAQAAMYCLTKDSAKEIMDVLMMTIEKFKRKMAFDFATQGGAGRRLNTEAMRQRNARMSRPFWWGR